MDNREKWQLREFESMPTNEVLKQVLSDESYAAYEELQDALPDLDIEQEWQWYKPYKAWFAKGQHYWMTPKGAGKDKNIYWLHVYDGYFCVMVWFKEKNRMELLNSEVSDKTKEMIRDAKEWSCTMPTFPVTVEVTDTEPLTDIFKLIACKKRLEAK